MDYTKYLTPASSSFYSCCNCGTDIKRGDLFCDCPDCAGLFCETCVRDGSFENHECEEDDD